MSCLYCEHCDELIDSDDDPDCFVGVGQPNATVACEDCRCDMEEAGELDFETNTLKPAPPVSINGETFPAFVARMEASAEEPT